MTEIVSDSNQLDVHRKYTYADYLTWRFDHMVEIIKGKLFKMSPAPDRVHQETVGNLYGLLWTYFRNKQCKVYTAPFDVRLPVPPGIAEPEKIDTVVQPDICVVCDPKKLDTKGCQGAPDWIVEILSNSTAQKDLHDKFEIYQFAGVREYWIIHPYEQTVLVYSRNDKSGLYELTRMNPFTIDEIVSSHAFPELQVKLRDVWTS